VGWDARNDRNGTVSFGNQVAIVGIGQSEVGRHLPDSQLALGAKALRAALEDSGLDRSDIDGLSLHMGWPLGADYDRIAEVYGLDVGYVYQAWTHGRFVTSALQHAAMAIATGMASVVACVTAISFTREKQILGGPGDHEGMREQGATHGENPVFGLTSPAAGAAFAMQRYMALHGVTSEELAAVPIALRQHAMLNPRALMRKPLTLADHQAARLIVDPLRLFDCSLVTDGAAVVLLTSAERARDLKRKPVTLAGMQGIRAGRNEFIFAPPGLGINQQPSHRTPPPERDLAVYRMAGVDRADMQGFYTYDAFSPLVLFALERFGFCPPREAARWVQGGRIGPGGELPVNTSGGLLSEAHVCGWNSICEMVRQLRGEAGPRQIPDASLLQWGTCWGDSVILKG
jgi:acetyl-CoA acetyltransferase